MSFYLLWLECTLYQYNFDLFMPPLFVECGRALSVAHVRLSVLPFVHHLGWYFVSATPPTIFSQSFWNFTGVFVKDWRCAWHLDITLRLILSLFSQFELSQFWAQLLLKLMAIRYLVSATPPTILSQSFWNFTVVFVKDWRCAWHLDITLRSIFVTFFTVWT